MIKRYIPWWLKPWTVDASFCVPSREPGIVFAVALHLEGLRPRRMAEQHAVAFTSGQAVTSIVDVARRYSVLCADAATIAATAACLAAQPERRGLRVDKAEVRLSSDSRGQTETRHLEVLRRTAQIAGVRAAYAAAQAEAVRHVVLDDHTTTVAYLLLTASEGTNLDTVPATAAKLRRHIDDYRPDERWIRVAEALNSLTSRKTPEEIKEMIGNLVDWAAVYDKNLSEGLRSTIDDDQ
ncbi:hypothetical protein AB0I28_33455 [Phytomonospora sp. NPDC050363]|uniref:hypothetical protein n=1 Tax=Phytomonospora sp. NPDC050363 TaxID=3155642 RepID=UPI0033CBE2A0